MHSILITGANGFLGYYLTEKLLKKGFRVIATGKGECRLPFKHPDFNYTSLDFTNNEIVKKVIQQMAPQTIVHAGAMSKPDECEQNKEAAFLSNVTGTKYLLDAAEKIKSFFVFISTDFVFDGDKGMYKEDNIRSAVNYYGETKLLAEDEVEKYPFLWSIIRTVLVYGAPRSGRQNILTNVAASLKKGEAVKIFDDQVRTPTYVEDLAWAISAILELQRAGIYHISGKDVLTPYEMAIAVAEYLHLDKNLIQKVTADAFYQLAKRPLKTGFDISKAIKDLQYAPTAFAEGLKKTLETVTNTGF